MIQLTDITPDNWTQAAALSVAPAQQRFLAPAIGILARGYVWRDYNARVWGIAQDGVLAGLALVRDLPEAPACYDLQQFMVDARFQRRGVGAAALAQLLARLAAEKRFDRVDICVDRAKPTGVEPAPV